MDFDSRLPKGLPCFNCSSGNAAADTWAWRQLSCHSTLGSFSLFRSFQPHIHCIPACQPKCLQTMSKEAPQRQIISWCSWIKKKRILWLPFLSSTLRGTLLMTILAKYTAIFLPQLTMSTKMASWSSEKVGMS